MIRLDSHNHFWTFDPVRDDWIDDSMEVLRQDFLPEDIYPHLRNHGFDGTIAVQADQSEEETRFLLHQADPRTSKRSSLPTPPPPTKSFVGSDISRSPNRTTGSWFARPSSTA